VRLSVSVFHHHDNIQFADIDIMLAKHLPNDPFDTISVYRARKYFFTRDYSKSGIFLAIANKKYPEIYIRNIFSVNYVVKTVFSQQSMRNGKFG